MAEKRKITVSEGKKITILVKESPFHGNFCEEALRASVGLAQTTENHFVRTVFVDNGVWFCTKDLKNKEFLKYRIAFKSFSMFLHVEKEALNNFDIDEENISSDFKISPRAEISKILLESDHVFTF